jgi:pantoate--beta-alanine ligase
MKIIQHPAKLSKLLQGFHQSNQSIGFVPTMGALHFGHLSLINQARRENARVVVSIFVNPVQFGPQEDLKKYPRPRAKDLELCRKAKVDFVFLPQVKDMYPENFSTTVDVGKLGNLLCGVFRPGHFDAVATVVTKLLNIVRPHMLYLGQKDAQQAIIVKKMVTDLNFPVKVKVMPTVRQENGLAMSSRNLYLNPQEAREACVLWEALNRAKELFQAGSRDYPGVIQQMKKMILKKSRIKIEYISIVDADSLDPVNEASRRILIALAVRVNKIRLIDNMVVSRVRNLPGAAR